MNKSYPFIITLTFLLILSSCSGIRFLTVETREPAQVTLPNNIVRVAVVNNVVEQPDDIGHYSYGIKSSVANKANASSDSVAIYYTEALAQFINEENHFQRVTYYNKPVRVDNDFFMETLLDPEVMNDIRRKTGADAVISLDKLIIQTYKKELLNQGGYKFNEMWVKINSTIRVYLPSMEGKIPTVAYTDSLYWVGYDAFDDQFLQLDTILSREEAMKTIAVTAAEKMTNVFTPHWERQDRWYYTSSSKLMREGEAFAKGAKWNAAIEKWLLYYIGLSERKKIDKAKVASNIALAYEMIGEMKDAMEWATVAYNLFSETTAPNSMERRRSQLYKNEIERRFNTFNTINMQNE